MAHPTSAATVELTQAERNITARNQLIDEFGALTRRELTAAGVPMDTPLLAVNHQDRELYPRFQFNDEGQPLPVMAEILTILCDVRSPWEIALWLTAANGWLGGRRPVDLLRTAPDRVIDAASHEAEPRVF